MLPFVPSGNIGLTELVQSAVQRLYGRDAVAPAEIYNVVEDGKVRMEVVRAGGRTTYSDDIKRWEGVNDKVREALAAGQIQGFVETTSGDEKRVPVAYWDCGTAWRAMVTGNLEYQNDPAIHRRPVYLRETDCADFIAKLAGEPVTTEKVIRTKRKPPAREAKAWAKKYYGESVRRGQRTSREQDEVAFQNKFTQAPKRYARELRRNHAPTAWFNPGPHGGKN